VLPSKIGDSIVLATGLNAPPLDGSNTSPVDRMILTGMMSVVTMVPWPVVGVGAEGDWVSSAY
jgi:hypothetical protein